MGKIGPNATFHLLWPKCRFWSNFSWVGLALGWGVRWFHNSLVLINQLFRPVRCTLCMRIVATSPFSTSFFFSSCVPSLQAIVLYTLQRWENVLNTTKATRVRYEWFVYHHSLYMALYTIGWMLSYTITRSIWFCIPSLVIHGFVYHCMNGFVYHHSLCMVVYTIVYMVLYTITRYTWFCIPVYEWYSIPSSL